MNEKEAAMTTELPPDITEELLSQCLATIRETNKANASTIQRRHRLGYVRAVRILDILAERKMIGPKDPKDPIKPREIYPAPQPGVGGEGDDGPILGPFELWANSDEACAFAGKHVAWVEGKGVIDSHQLPEVLMDRADRSQGPIIFGYIPGVEVITRLAPAVSPTPPIALVRAEWREAARKIAELFDWKQHSRTPVRNSVCQDYENQVAAIITAAFNSPRSETEGRDKARLDWLERQLQAHDQFAIVYNEHDGRRWSADLMTLLVRKHAERGGNTETLRQAIDAALAHNEQEAGERKL